MAGCFLTYLARGLHGVYQVRFLHGVIPNLVFTADCYVHIILKKNFLKHINNCCENTCFTSYGKPLVAIGLVFGGVILFLKPLLEWTEIFHMSHETFQYTLHTSP